MKVNLAKPFSLLMVFLVCRFSIGGAPVVSCRTDTGWPGRHGHSFLLEEKVNEFLVEVKEAAVPGSLVQNILDVQEPDQVYSLVARIPKSPSQAVCILSEVSPLLFRCPRRGRVNEILSVTNTASGVVKELNIGGFVVESRTLDRSFIETDQLVGHEKEVVFHFEINLFDASLEFIRRNIVDEKFPSASCQSRKSGS